MKQCVLKGCDPPNKPATHGKLLLPKAGGCDDAGIGVEEDDDKVAVEDEDDDVAISVVCCSSMISATPPMCPAPSTCVTTNIPTCMSSISH